MFRVVQGGGILLLTIVLSGCSENSQQAGQSADDTSRTRQSLTSTAPHAPQISANKSSRDQTWSQEYKLKEYPGGAFALADPGSPPTGDAAAVIKSLETIAKSGNSKASFEIYQKIQECLDIIQNQDGTEQISTGYEKHKKEASNRCKNLSTDDYARASEWLELAATQGSLPAQLIYSTNISASLGGDAADYIRDPDGVANYKERAITFLNNASKMGSIDALGILSDYYQNGVMVEQNSSISYAYLAAIAKAAPDLTPKRQMNILERSLSPSEITEARRKAEEIFNECCNQRTR